MFGEHVSDGTHIVCGPVPGHDIEPRHVYESVHVEVPVHVGDPGMVIGMSQRQGLSIPHIWLSVVSRQPTNTH
ncbi:MAG: hypothetical protein GF341_10655 [candidate division Zixibacteria bacterium]|nr:hypothetical protein [candidate division Zixibacteria bacterium]